MSVIANFLKQYNAFCQLLPPGVDTSLSAFLSNLPIIFLFLVTTPIRFFVCIFSTITKINFICALFNLFPPANLVLPFITSKTPQSCSTQCQYCSTSEGTCINYYPKLLKYFNQCSDQMSVFNKVFCLLGVIIANLLNPFLVFVNPLIYLSTHKVICLNTDPSICGI